VQCSRAARKTGVEVHEFFTVSAVSYSARESVIRKYSVKFSGEQANGDKYSAAYLRED
jgi:hypothetical protein